MSNVYKQLNCFDGIAGAAFGGSGGSSSSKKKKKKKEESSYPIKDGNGAAVSYQNTMRSIGYLNTQDYAGEQEAYFERTSKNDLSNLATGVGMVLSVFPTANLVKLAGTVIVVASERSRQ